MLLNGNFIAVGCSAFSFVKCIGPYSAGENLPFQSWVAPTGKCARTQCSNKRGWAAGFIVQLHNLKWLSLIRFEERGRILVASKAQQYSNPITDISAHNRANQDYFGTFQHGCHRWRKCRLALPGSAWSYTGHQLHLVFQWNAHRFQEGRFSFWEGWRGELQTSSHHWPYAAQTGLLFFLFSTQ